MGSYGRLNAMANQETASLQGQINSLEAMLGALLRTQYGVLDFVRRMQGDALSALGLGPNEWSR